MKTSAINPRFVEVDITDPKANRTIYRDNYWLCVEGDETRALMFKSSENHLAPQCNKNESICMSSLKYDMYKKLDAQVVFMAVAFVPSEFGG